MDQLITSTAAISLISSVIGGLLTLSGTYLAYKLEEKQGHKEFLAKKAIYHKLIIQEFEKSIMVLNCHTWRNNPYEDIDYKFFNQHRFEFAHYIPDEVFEYGEFLKQCEARLHSIDNGEPLEEMKEDANILLMQAKSRLNFLYTL